MDENNPYLQMLKRVQDQFKEQHPNGISTTTTIHDDPNNPIAFCGLDNLDCPLCENRGYIWEMRDGMLFSKECRCMAKRRTIKSIGTSGMKDLIEKYTMETYQAEDSDRNRIKKKAIEFSETDSGWFYIAGQSGSGKTHICSAICKMLSDRGKQVMYMLWRDEAVRLKSIVTDQAAYQKAIGPLKSAPVLYIDDFFKGKVTEADVNLAFEILNYRYNNDRLRTVISSELIMEKIMEIDEAVGGRIFEKTKGFFLRAPSENWRLK